MNKGIGALISGFGDYKIENNTLMTGGLDPPNIVNSVNNGNMIVRHREYLGDISATVAFTIQSYPLNPGLMDSFPWLSSIAQHFEQYKFRGVIFEFKSLSSDAVLSASTSSALGSVIMATQYNALNPAFPDKFTMENYEFANSSKPSLSFIHPVECLKKDTSVLELYVRGSAAPAGSDLRLFDLGNFYVATVGMQAASGIAGELWCTYEIELIKPKISNPLNIDHLMDHFRLSPTLTNAAPFTAATLHYSTLGGALSPNVYSFPTNISSGVYLLFWEIVGSSTAITQPTPTPTNCTVRPIFANGTASIIGTPTGTTSTFTFHVMCVTINASPAFMSYSTSGVYPASPTAGDFFVIELPGNVTKINEELTISNTMDEVDSLLHRLSKLGLTDLAINHFLKSKI